MDERRILVAADAVIDALGAEQRERLADVRRGAFLAGVGDRVEALCAGPREHPRELRRWIAALAGVETDADELVAVGQGGGERGERVFLGEVAEEAQDQRRGDAVLRASIGHRVVEAVEDRRHRDAADRVGLRIEEQLGVDDPIGRGALEVRGGERAKVVAIAEHVAAGVVEIEERLEVAELVGGADLVDRGVRELRTVLLGEREHQLGLERALDMQVKLDLG